MYLISHRGNLNGIIKDRENSPRYINEALEKGYDVEIDVRVHNDKFFLGHHEPKYEVQKDFLLNKKLWCHAKDIHALEKLKQINKISYRTDS